MGMDGGAAHGVAARKDARSVFTGASVEALAFGIGVLLVGKEVGLAAVVRGQDSIREGRREGASRSSSSVSDDDSVAA